MKKGIILLLQVLLIASSVFAQTSLIPFASSWNYLDNGSDQGTAWRDPSFSVSWPSASAKFGYGISDAATLIKYGSDKKNKYVTTYFRKTVTLTTAYDSYQGKLKRDDGAVVYVNGVAVYRNNLPSTYNYTTLASASGDKGLAALTFTISPSAFVNGNNIIAVEVHISKANDQDMAFDFGLDGVQVPPTVTSINRQSPTVVATNATSVVFRVVFSEPVAGVDAGDFTATSVTGSISSNVSNVASVGSDGTTYDVTVSAISGDGSLRLDLKSSGTGIVDNNNTAINGGYASGQTYTIDQTAPAVVSLLRQLPTTSITNATSVVYRITFSEKVLGVDATDFTPVIISGSLSANVTGIAAVGTDGTTYDVTLGSVSGNGLLRLDLNASGTGIADNVGNALSGGYTGGQKFTIDQIAPAVTGVVRGQPTTQNTDATSVTFRVSFSEGVKGVDAGDFSLVAVSGSISGSVIGALAVSTTGSDYDVTVSSFTGSGELRLDVSGTGITDTAGNVLAAGYSSGETYNIQQSSIQPGFTSVTPLTPVDITTATKDKPQSKVWNYAGQWWCVLAATGGTKVFRLDGTTWTAVLSLTSSSSKPDCWVVGSVVHLLLYKGASNNSYLYSIEYDAATNTYKLWNKRPSSVTLVFPAGSETATLVVDTQGRMWVASDGVTDMSVWWSDAPYSSWSAPITIASGMIDDDICTLAALPSLGKIGLFWSNQTTKRFGFKTHSDSDNPATWSSDELPAAQSAIDNVGSGLADDHMNVKVASDGTLYCAAKTGYNKTGYPKVILLVRRPNGSWDDLYPVSMNPEGTQPIVILNEALGKIKVVYATIENGGDIVYRESATSNISFSAAMPLISGGGYLYDYTTSTHQNYTSDIVIMATNLSTSPLRAVGVLARDGAAPAVTSGALSAQTAIEQKLPLAIYRLHPNPLVGGGATLNFTLSQAGPYSLSLYDMQGAKVSQLAQGWSEAGVSTTTHIDGRRLASGLYLLHLQTSKGVQVFKLMKK